MPEHHTWESTCLNSKNNFYLPCCHGPKTWCLHLEPTSVPPGRTQTFTLFYFTLLYSLFYFVFLVPHPLYIKVPRLGVELELQSQQCQIWATSATYTTAYSNARSLTHQAGQGMEPAFSQILVAAEPWWELLRLHFRLTESKTWEIEPSNLCVRSTPCNLVHTKVWEPWSFGIK